MGLMDKLKATAKNADSKAGEIADKQKVQSKISDEKRAIDKALDSIGKAYYDAYKEGKDVSADLDAICKEIDDHKAKIAEYEEEIKAIEAKGKEEREQNRAEAEAAAAAKAEARAAAKAETNETINGISVFSNLTQPRYSRFLEKFPARILNCETEYFCPSIYASKLFIANIPNPGSTNGYSFCSFSCCTPESAV